MVLQKAVRKADWKAEKLADLRVAHWAAHLDLKSAAWSAGGTAAR